MKLKYPTPKCTGLSGGSGGSCQIDHLAFIGVLSYEEWRSLRNGWTGGKLNPNWEEWLMGWPIGWTSLNPLQTVRLSL